MTIKNKNININMRPVNIEKKKRTKSDKIIDSNDTFLKFIYNNPKIKNIENK